MSPVLSEVLAALGLAFISLVVLLTLRYYLPLRQTPGFYLVPIFFALFLPAGIVLLVPIDLASSSVAEDVASRGIWLPQRLLLVWWRITYWLTFCLTWFILPILGEYSDSGFREPYDRFMYSLHQNAQFHAMVFGSAIVGLVYLIFSYGFTMSSIKTTVMALSYCWGLLFAIYLMGHGLVSVPRTLFRNASLSGRLRRLQAHAPRLHEKLDDAQLALEDVELSVAELARRKGTSGARDFSEWIDELVDIASMTESVIPRTDMDTRARSERRPLPTVITDKYMADISRQLMRARHARSRYAKEWQDLVSEAAHTQMLLDSMASRKLVFGAPPADAVFWERITILTPYARYLLYVRVVPALRMLLGGILSLASVCIVWSEVVKDALPQLSLVRLSVVHHWTKSQETSKGQVGFGGQIIAAAWLLYMCVAVFASISEVKVWRGRALVRRNTAHESGFWYAGQVAKLSVPLSYNFLTFVSPEFEDTVFHEFLGKYVDFTALGRGFNLVFPVLVLVPVFAALFGLYGRVRRALGFDFDILDGESDDESGLNGYGTGSWREGRDLIERDLGGNSLAARRAEAIDRLNARARGPILTVPPAPGSPHVGSSQQGSSRALGRNTAAAQRERQIAAEHAAADSGNFFQLLGHRMKNTIDTIDTPRWLQDLGDNIRPPWASDESAQGSGDGNGIMRLFGGANGSGGPGPGSGSGSGATGTSGRIRL
ncbi:hypothetical protein TD95_002323 [Thielaviopsis punctulata]|uniref:Uncharacterized protein n=1 Tax=Thielaviopsis punctulata TaxID=72032 RepID=A0A0F4ZC37_9PEZI|nr:hypothetical protein TD95_002323 [Thielaviopsis punctulata]